MATALLTGFLLLIALLAIPLSLRFHIAWDQTLTSQLRLQWAFGLIRITLPPLPDRPFRFGAKPSPVRQPDKSPSSRLKLSGALRQSAFRRRLLRFIGAIWRAFNKRELKLYLRIGLGDPAATGQLWALLGPLAGILATARDADIAIEPVFIEQTFELDSSGHIQVIPLQLIVLTLALLLSPALWGELRQARS